MERVVHEVDDILNGSPSKGEQRTSKALKEALHRFTGPWPSTRIFSFWSNSFAAEGKNG